MMTSAEFWGVNRSSVFGSRIGPLAMLSCLRRFFEAVLEKQSDGQR
jgi:hypothetical protein